MLLPIRSDVGVHVILSHRGLVACLWCGSSGAHGVSGGEVHQVFTDITIRVHGRWVRIVVLIFGHEKSWVGSSCPRVVPAPLGWKVFSGGWATNESIV